MLRFTKEVDPLDRNTAFVVPGTETLVDWVSGQDNAATPYLRVDQIPLFNKKVL